MKAKIIGNIHTTEYNKYRLRLTADGFELEIATAQVTWYARRGSTYLPLSINYYGTGTFDLHIIYFKITENQQ